jgi:DNA-binding NarL/FixJ family response regulator
MEASPLPSNAEESVMVQLQPPRVNVAIQHHEPLLARGVHSALSGTAGIRLVEAGGGSPDDRAHVVVTDWAQADRLLSVGRSAWSRAPGELVIAAQVRQQPLVTAMRRGLGGLVLASCHETELLTAVRAVAAGHGYICAEVAQRIAADFAREPLTTREEDVLQLLARGLCNKSIAGQLGIAVGTVKAHVKAIFAKLEASSRTEAASIATELGMVTVPGFAPREALALS